MKQYPKDTNLQQDKERPQFYTLPRTKAEVLQEVGVWRWLLGEKIELRSLPNHSTIIKGYP